MAQLASNCAVDRLADAPLPGLTGETRDRLGRALREVYVETCESRPITDVQVELLLRLRQKERDRRRGA
ncbi:hypothetical protein [Methylobacterium sp. Leaf118]|uniref:hypothetical protein n=1 Tax=Methylobacterium sp. Leaf118 TaxID=2876562 RepID=UPI001E4C39CE|nr:hypothetical protein [Methylobacterium sp. Leaf118]